jgi:glucose/arabinose dehydrogenase
MRAVRGKIWIVFSLLSCFSIPAHVRAQAVPGLAAVRVATGLTAPLFATTPPGDFNRLFIVQQTGQIRILNLATGTLNSTAFLDIHTSIVSGGEQGLLGLAFDPDYTTNGKFYVDFTASGGTYGNGVTHIAQFTVSANPDVADPTSVKTLLTFDQPQTNHNGGWIAFSPRAGDDHNLYIATGDGGNGNDQDNGVGHIEPGGNAQNTTTLLGKMLRIHVDPATGTYSIPSNNPFFGSATSRQEIWAYGLRNPFRDSFDRLNGRMFIGDVGQDTREEIDVQEATNPGGGENYEWRLREGFIATPTGSPVVGGDRPPGGIDPIYDYPHSTGQTIIGGYVYRGKQIPALRGTYVFADYLGPEPKFVGKVFSLDYDGTSAGNFQDITAELFPTSTGGYNLSNPTSLGEDANGELYICDISAGSVYKIVPVTPNVTIDSIARDSQSGHIVLNGSGVPFKVHTVKATADLTQPFMTIGTATAAGDGTFQFEDATNLSARFYRVVYPSGAMAPQSGPTGISVRQLPRSRR